MCVSRDDDWSQTQTQTEEAPITDEDLEVIKERETNIRQLEVGGPALQHHGGLPDSKTLAGQGPSDSLFSPLSSSPTSWT